MSDEARATTYQALVQKCAEAAAKADYGAAWDGFQPEMQAGLLENCFNSEAKAVLAVAREAVGQMPAGSSYYDVLALLTPGESR